jgi:hypothetical protein
MIECLYSNLINLSRKSPLPMTSQNSSYLLILADLFITGQSMLFTDFQMIQA